MNKWSIFLFFFLLFHSSDISAQDTLPAFSAREIGNGKAQISWINPFSNCTQLSVQMSYDSLRYFSTLFSPQSPELPQNGFIDNHVLKGIKTYYRIFYVLDDGTYYFSKSKTAVKGNARNTMSSAERYLDSIYQLQNFIASPDIKYISIYKKHADSLYRRIESWNYNKFKDSIRRFTKDTLYFIGKDSVQINPYIPIPVWIPSKYVFTNDDGALQIELAMALKKKYRLVIYDENNKEQLELKHIPAEKLVLDKDNFIKAGWYYFELYEDAKLKERNKFLLERDF